MIHCTTKENRSRFLTSLEERERYGLDWVDWDLKSGNQDLPEDTHALLGVPVVQELQTGEKKNEDSG